MKMGSLKTQVELDGINGAHTNTRTIIARALFHYETFYQEHLEEIKDSQGIVAPERKSDEERNSRRA